MDIRVRGGQTVSGEIAPSGSKNSAVALVTSTILFDRKVTLKNVPEITDIKVMVGLLKKMGSKIDWNKKEKVLSVDNSKITFSDLDEKDLGNLRGTSLLWGPMLARFGKVDVKDLPGGCTLGVRPLDTHYLAFNDLGVKVKETRCSVEMDATSAKSATIWLYEMSPTATENAVMLATSIKGNTKIVGAASEPQVQDLCNFLVKCGANIRGIGSNILEIDGGRYLTPKDHTLLCDHYEVTTFLALAATTGGKIKINTRINGLIQNVLKVFELFNLKIDCGQDYIKLAANQKIKIQGSDEGKALQVKAQPWPGLPVDTLPLFIPLALKAKKGQVMFHNWMYEAGLFWTSELTKLGANIIMGDPHRVIVTAGNKLKGGTLEAPYIIRAVVAMVMSAMIASGETTILDADTIHRGHPDFVKNLRKLGAKIEEIEEASR